MRTLNNNTLLYDEDCPLCLVYTSGFIKVGMLDKNGRKSFNSISESEHNFINIERASNEIALIDNKNKTVTYGIDSLLKVIGVQFPIIETIGKIKPVHFLLRKLYSFISYNRKVIIPSPIKEKSVIKCEPTFNVKYRLLFILVCILVTCFTLFQFSTNISILNNSTFLREGLITVGQIVFQIVFLYKLRKKRLINYIGNLMTISLMGSLLLISLLLVKSVFNLTETSLLLGFGLTVIIMFLEHIRRVKTLHLPSYLTLTWVSYRIIILGILLS